MVSERWSNGLGTKSWQFNLGKEHFAGECYIRIRGIVGWVVGGDDSLWTLKVHLPDMPTMIYPTGWTTNPDSAQDVKDFTLSCVTKRANRPNPDLSGITSCYNACPIGDWQIRIQNAFDESAQVHVDDVQMDLYLSVLPL
jgi:hypothetical protein